MTSPGAAATSCSPWPFWPRSASWRGSSSPCSSSPTTCAPPTTPGTSWPRRCSDLVRSQWPGRPAAAAIRDGRSSAPVDPVARGVRPGRPAPRGHRGGAARRATRAPRESVRQARPARPVPQDPRAAKAATAKQDSPASRGLVVRPESRGPRARRVSAGNAASRGRPVMLARRRRAGRTPTRRAWNTSAPRTATGPGTTPAAPRTPRRSRSRLRHRSPAASWASIRNDDSGGETWRDSAHRSSGG